MSSTQRLKNVSYFPAVPTDQQFFNFQPPWNDGSFNASSVGQSGTLFTTNDPTANMTFTFPVEANAFYYYGILRSRGGEYAICIDCHNDAPIFLPVNGLNTSDDGKNPPVVLYSQIFSDFGIHTFIIANQNDTRVVPSGNSQITLERIDLTVVDDSAVGATTTSGTATTSSSLSATSAASSSGSSSSTPVGAIVGASIGGTLAAIVILLLFFFLVRRRRRRRAEDTTPPEGTIMTGATGYSSYPASYMVNGFQNDDASSLARSQSFYYPSTGQEPSSGSAYSPRGDGASQSTRGTGPRREVDAGRVYSEGEEEDTLPPEYGQVFNRLRTTIRRPSGRTSSLARMSIPSASNASASNASASTTEKTTSSAGAYTASSGQDSRRPLPPIVSEKQPQAV